MSQILTVDFTTKQLIGHECVPKREKWQCDVCTKVYTLIDGDPNNVKRIEFEKDVKTTSGKTSLKVGFKICEKCCHQIGDLFKGE